VSLADPASPLLLVDPVPQAAASARAWLRPLVAAIDPELASVSVLLISEVVTNSILHARTPIAVAAEAAPGRVRVWVADRSSELPSARLYGPRAGTGRGLVMVESLAARWGVTAQAAGKVVWFEVSATSGGPDPTPIPSEPVPVPTPAELLAWLRHGPRPTTSDRRAALRWDRVPVAGASLRRYWLLGIPPALLERCREEYAAFLRELRLVAQRSADDAARLGPLLLQQGKLGERLATFALAADSDVQTIEPGAEAGQVDLALDGPVALGLNAARYSRLLDDAERAAAAGDWLLGPGPSAPVVAFRRWLLGQIDRQADDRPPRPWLGVPEASPDLEERLRVSERRLSLLLRASFALARGEDVRDTLTRLAHVAVPELADLCLIDLREESGSIHRVAAVHADPTLAEVMAELEERYAPAPEGAHPAAAVLESGLSRWEAQLSDEFLRASTRDERHYQRVKELGLSSYLCVPILAPEGALGAITLVVGPSGRHFAASDVGLCEELAGQVAQVLISARRFDREHQLARDLQSRLLPPTPTAIPGLDVAVRYQAGVEAGQVGGDFYDFLVLPSGRAGIAVGDVEGHDAGAAALMGQLRSATRALAGQIREPGPLIEGLQWSWDFLGFDRLATACFARLDPATGDLVLVSAGHPPPVRLGPAGADFLPVEPGPPLGIAGGRSPELRTTVEVGETVVFFTDGLVESRDRTLDEGLERLRSLLAELRHASPDEICEQVLTRLSAGRHLPDDAAIMAVRRHAL
jgi:serine phosphatase RsbU (regulator of sigma subunit)/anti-sigma regulatory factor (Ser/Thr protein kinase)